MKSEKKNIKDLEKLLKEQNISVSKAHKIIFDTVNKKESLRTILKNWRFCLYARFRVKDFLVSAHHRDKNSRINKYIKSIEPWFYITVIKDKKSKKSFIKVGSQTDENRFKLFPILTVKKVVENIVKDPDYKKIYIKQFSKIRPFDEYDEIKTFQKSLANEIHLPKYNEKFYNKRGFNFPLDTWKAFKIIR